MKCLYTIVLFCVLFINSFAQPALPDKFKFGISTDELTSSFNNDGITTFDKSAINTDFLWMPGASPKYWIPSYSVDGSNYAVVFFLSDNKVKAVSFVLTKDNSEQNADNYEEWDKNLTKQYGAAVKSEEWASSDKQKSTYTKRYAGPGVVIELNYAEELVGPKKRKEAICYVKYMPMF